jgi:hypothetical protein
VKPTWLQRSPTLLSIGPPASPKPNLWKLTECLFPPIPGDDPLSNGQLGLFKMQLTVSVRSDVTLLGVKLKVAVLSINSLKFVYTLAYYYYYYYYYYILLKNIIKKFPKRTQVEGDIPL